MPRSSDFTSKAADSQQLSMRVMCSERLLVVAVEGGLLGRPRSRSYEDYNNNKNSFLSLFKVNF